MGTPTAPGGHGPAIGQIKPGAVTSPMVSSGPAADVFSTDCHELLVSPCSANVGQIRIWS